MICPRIPCAGGLATCHSGTHNRQANWSIRGLTVTQKLVHRAIRLAVSAGVAAGIAFVAHGYFNTASAADDSTCRPGYHPYPAATITTISGAKVTLAKVSIHYNAESLSYYSYSAAEVDSVAYINRTNLGPEFKGSVQTIFLYTGSPRISFKEIAFSREGEAQSMQFQNHDALSAKDVIITFPNKRPDYTPDVWSFSGCTMNSGHPQGVNVQGSKIKEIVFDGSP